MDGQCETLLWRHGPARVAVPVNSIPRFNSSRVGLVSCSAFLTLGASGLRACVSVNGANFVLTCSCSGC